MQNFIDWFAQIFILLQSLWQIITWVICDCIPDIFAFVVNHPIVALMIIAPAVGTYLKRQ